MLLDVVKRKVAQIGPSTLMISLPSKWVKEFGVKKGDEVEVSINGRNLVVGTSKLKKNEPLRINLEGLNANLIRYFIYSAYRIGADDIELTFEKDNVVDKKLGKTLLVHDIINSAVDNLVGFEVMTQKNNYIKIKEISGVNIDEFNNTLMRIFVTLLNTSGDMADAIENKNKVLLERIKNLSDRKVNKLCDFCHRIINKGGIVESNKAPQYYSVISTLEDIGDSLDEICGIALTDEVRSKEVQKLKELINMLYRLFCQYDKNNLDAFYSVKNEVKNIKAGGRLKIELSKIATYCSKLMPELITLNLENGN